MTKKEVYMLELFVMHSCPYCRKVMEYFDSHDVEYVKNDISYQENHERLMNLGGMEQVPFLYDKEKSISMYESDDIIKYVSENIAK